MLLSVYVVRQNCLCWLYWGCLFWWSRREGLKAIRRKMWCMCLVCSVQFSLVAQSCPTLCNPMDCSTPGFPVHHQLLELLKLMSIDAMWWHRCQWCQPTISSSSLLLLPSIFPNELVLHIRWPKYWSFSFSISPSNEYSGLISFKIDWSNLLAFQGLSRIFSNTTVQKHQFSVLSFLYSMYYFVFVLQEELNYFL